HHKNGSIKRILITTVPFGEINPRPLEMLDELRSVEYLINPLGRKLKEVELIDLIPEFDVVIAGTEPITRQVLQRAPNLKVISRVGIGLDNVDLSAARELGIEVLYTPDAPSAAVAELTIAHMLNLLRHLPQVDRKMRSGTWQRQTGDRLANQTVGIIGVGRIGSRVLRILQGFQPGRILVNDLRPDVDLYRRLHAEHVDKETLYREADIISLHVPLTRKTKSLISANEIELMRSNVRLINTSRGAIVDEAALYAALKAGRIAGAALDVFEAEPYCGKLTELGNCLLSCHLGSMTRDCRAEMELRATEGVVRFVRGEKPLNVVPQEEYENQL
ncbi:MAG: phosphoglycerate dehydrogenase, partial [bacterium]